MEKIKKVGKILLKRTGATKNKKRLRRSRSMPLNELNNVLAEAPGPSLYSQPNSRFSKASPNPTPTYPGPPSRQLSANSQAYIASQIMPTLPPQMLEQQERERERQYNRDLASYKLENRDPFLLQYRQATIDSTHSTSRSTTSPVNEKTVEKTEPVRGELQWDWNFPEDWRAKRKSARKSQNTAYMTQWHRNASCEHVGPLTVL